MHYEPLEPRQLFAMKPIIVGPVRVAPFVPPRPIAATPPAINLRATTVSPIEVDLVWGPGASPRRAGAPTTRAASTPAGYSGYRIERSLNGGAYTPVATVAGTATTYHDLGLISNSPYAYRVRGFRGVDTLYLSKSAGATTAKYDAGLNATFSNPSAVTGTTRSILSYGATANSTTINDDSVALKNAIAASSSGDEVYIPDGRYDFLTRDLRLKTGVSIRGQSQAGTIINAIFTDVGTDNANSEVFHAAEGIKNLTMSNFSIRSSGGQSMQYGFYLGSGSDTAAVVTRIAVKNVTVENFEKMALAVRNGDNMLVQGCTFKNATALGGGGEGYGVMLGYADTQNCWITGNTFGPVLRHGVVVQYFAHHNLIENNVADNCTIDAYDLHGENEYSNELRFNVAKNIDGGDGFGIGNTGATHDDSGPNNWIHNNEVFNSRGGGNIILGSDNEILEDNNFHDNTDYGVRVYNGGGANLWFLRNSLTNNDGKGADISEAPGLLMIGNIITGNTGAALTTDANTISYKILENDLRNNGSAYSLGSSDGIFSDNLV